MDSSGIDLGIYSSLHVTEVIVSCAFFILFFIAQTLDFNSVLLDFGVTESAISRGKLMFVYIFGYFLFIIKFFLAFIFFTILILVIVIIFTSFYSVMNIVMEKEFGNTTGDSVDERIQKIVKNKTIPLFEQIKGSCFWMGRYLVSFISMKQFISIYIVAIPMFLFFVYLLYSQTLYNPSNIEKNPNKSNIMNTNHMYLFFIFVSLAIMAFVYLCYNYAVSISG